MATIDLTVHPDRLERAVQRARERNIIIPTFAQMKDPALIPAKVKEELAQIGLWDVAPRNLFRITWHNEPIATRRRLRRRQLPRAALQPDRHAAPASSPWSASGSPPARTKSARPLAAWCRAWSPVSSTRPPRKPSGPPPAITAAAAPTTPPCWPANRSPSCPKGMSQGTLRVALQDRRRNDQDPRLRIERQRDLRQMLGAAQIRPGPDDLQPVRGVRQLPVALRSDRARHGRSAASRCWARSDSYRGMASATGSAGTIASGDYMKQLFPDSKIVASEALQCPTLLENGFGAHRIEGIGDKHVPWIHNVKNTDMVIAIDDNAVVNIARLFNEPAGRDLPGRRRACPRAIVSQLDLLGFSGISNVLSAIKFAKYYEMGENDVMLTVLTDSMELYRTPPA